MNDKLEDKWKEADVTYFKALARNDSAMGGGGWEGIKLKSKYLGGVYKQAAVAYLGSICPGQAEENYIKSVRIACTLHLRWESNSGHPE
jgi:hypothetical protein